jgi:chromosome segregation ATPase
MEIAKLVDDNQKLSKLCSDQDKTINGLEVDRSKLLSKNEETNFELKNVQGRLKAREENLSYVSKQLDDAKMGISKLQHSLKEAEKQIDNQRLEISTLNHNLNREKSMRAECEKSNDQLSNILNEKDKEITRFIKELDNSRSNNQRMNEEKVSLASDNERLRNHIVVVTEQNQKLIMELEDITEQDERISKQLMRREKTTLLLRNNKAAIEKSLTNLDDFLSKSGGRRNMSPSH